MPRKDEPDVEATGQRVGPPATRRPYHTPVLKRLGTVAELTNGATGATSDGTGNLKKGKGKPG
jgi:hypothetical protein